ncbi:MAG: hypothetical protein QXF12_05790 [Candidatus Aenigmatarchaeota archaeon]
MDSLDAILQNLGISGELRMALKDAWEERLNQERRILEEKVRDEFSYRYEVDKSRLVESMEKFLTEKLINEVKIMKKSLINEVRENLLDKVKNGLERIEQEKNNFDQKIINIKENFKSKLDGFINFANRKLNEELKELRSDIKKIKEEREKRVKFRIKLESFINFANKKLNEEIEELRKDIKKLREERENLKNARMEYKRIYEERISNVEKFLIEQLTKELVEFHKDKKILEERRIELELQASKRLDAVKKVFIERATKLIEHIVNTEMKKELKQLKEDIIVAKQNDFGRKIYEAFVAEYMSSFLEDAELSKLKKKLNESNKTIEDLKKQLNEHKIALKKSREEIVREKTLSNLLAPLSQNQRKVMLNLLEGVKTEDLQSYFKKYLPRVLEEIPSSVNYGSNRSLISESENSSTIVTGDRMKLFEDDDEKNAVIELRKLAGIK